MAASVQFRPQNRDLGMVMREVDEDLAIFLGIRNGEKDKNHDHLVSNGVVPKLDNLLDSENDKNDHDWLISQHDITLLPLEKLEGKDSRVPNEDTNRRRPLSSGGRKAASRPATPTGRRSLPVKSKPSTPTLRTTLPSSKPVASQPRSATPSRSSTPRSSTPTRKPATPSTTSSASVAVRSSGSKNPMPAVKTRPASASRGRPSSTATTCVSSSNGKPRQKSCSPAKTRVPSTTNAHKYGNIMLSRSRGYGVGGDDVNPVLMGTKMVERVVNMRKLAPPKQDECDSVANMKKSSQEKSGFGRSLSKKSLDMAMRHMDITRSVSDNLRPVATGGSSSCKSSASESTITSGSDSSKSSNSYFTDGNRMDD